MTATNSSTGATQTTTSSGTGGTFSFSQLPAGTYSVTVSNVSGYAGANWPNVSVTSGDITGIDIHLVVIYAMPT